MKWRFAPLFLIALLSGCAQALEFETISSGGGSDARRSSAHHSRSFASLSGSGSIITSPRLVVLAKTTPLSLRRPNTNNGMTLKDPGFETGLENLRRFTSRQN